MEDRDSLLADRWSNFIDSITPIATALYGQDLNRYNEAAVASELSQTAWKPRRGDVDGLNAEIAYELNNRTRAGGDSIALDWLLALSLVSLCAARVVSSRTTIRTSLLLTITAFTGRYLYVGTIADYDAAFRYLKELVSCFGKNCGWEHSFEDLQRGLAGWSNGDGGDNNCEREAALLLFASECAINVSDRIEYSMAASASFVRYYQQSADDAAFHKAIDIAIGVTVRSKIRSVQAEAMSIISAAQSLKYRRHGGRLSLESWVRTAESAAEFASDSNMYAEYARGLVAALVERYSVSGLRSDLDRVTTLLSDLVETESDTEERVNDALLLGSALLDRSERFATYADITRCVDMIRAVYPFTAPARC